MACACANKKKSIEVPTNRRIPKGYIEVVGARENNLKNVSVKFPLGVMTCVTGVSGSGKSSLVDRILMKALLSRLNKSNDDPGEHDTILGIEQLDKIVDIS